MTQQDKLRRVKSSWMSEITINPLGQQMVEDTSKKGNALIKSILHEGYINEMTTKWLSLTPSPPRIPVFYTLTKIPKPKPVGTPIIGSLRDRTAETLRMVQWQKKVAPHIFVILPSWVFQPSCCVSSLNSGCDGTIKRLSSFDDRLIQLIAQIQESHLRGTTNFINFIEKIKLPKNTSLVSMDVTSLYMYTNIPQEQEGIL